MDEEDHLEVIKERMRRHADTPELRQRYYNVHAAMDLRWLIDEVELLRELRERD